MATRIPGRRLSVTLNEIARMMEGYKDWDCCMVIFPVGDQSGLRYININPELAAEMLYRVADELVRQRIPLKPLKAN